MVWTSLWVVIPEYPRNAVEISRHRTRQRLDEPPRPPFPSGNGVQRLSVEGATILFDESADVLQYVDYSSSTEVTAGQRRRIDHTLAPHGPRPANPVYLPADHIEAGALPGRFIPIGARSDGVLAWVAVGFSALLLGLALVYRLLRRTASLEQAEAFIEREIDSFPI